MVLNKGIYTLKRTKDSDEPSSSHSRSSLSEISLTFFDNQPPIGENNLSYVKRRWEIIEEGAKAYAERLKLKTPEKLQSFRANSRTICRAKTSRLPASKETCNLRAHSPASSTASTQELVETCWKEEPPDKNKYNDETNDVITDLYKIQCIASTYAVGAASRRQG